MKSPNPKTLHDKTVWFILKNLPGLLFILLLLGVSMFLWWNIVAKKTIQEVELQTATSGETPAINVVTLELRPTVLRDKINLPGLVEPWTKLELMAKVGGSIDEIYVREGDYVKKSQRIARIETKDYQIALDSAKAAYALRPIMPATRPCAARAFPLRLIPTSSRPNCAQPRRL